MRREDSRAEMILWRVDGRSRAARRRRRARRCAIAGPRMVSLKRLHPVESRISCESLEGENEKRWL